MPSLRELQVRFADALRDESDASPQIAVYRDTVRANYRNALGATYPVVHALVGTPFFNAAVDAYARACPSTGGDLNVYGATFADFLAAYPHAAHLAYLPDVARLEWALDEAARAADVDAKPHDVTAAIAAADTPAERALALHPSCRLLASGHPVWRIWHAHQHDDMRDMAVELDGARDHLLVHREDHRIAVERIPSAEWTFLRALVDGATLGAALAQALDVDATFDLAALLRARIADGTIVGLREREPA